MWECVCLISVCEISAGKVGQCSWKDFIGEANESTAGLFWTTYRQHESDL